MTISKALIAKYALHSVTDHWQDDCARRDNHAMWHYQGANGDQLK